MKALISIHDVMPETLPRVTEWVNALGANGYADITLLVVPGRHWPDGALEQLAQWQKAGMELAAHGWSHHARDIGSLFHLAHSLVLSRRAAEHLAHKADEIETLMRASADWFPAHGLDSPTTYVPPAWALGRIKLSALRRLPYRQIEVTGGILDVDSGRLWRLPLVGYEADIAIRAHFLRGWNGYQQWRARTRQVPLRIGIHPDDGQLRLAEDLQALLSQPWSNLRYDDYATERRNAHLSGAL